MGAAISAFILSVHPTVGDAARVGELADLAAVRGEERANFGQLYTYRTIICYAGNGEGRPKKSPPKMFWRVARRNLLFDVPPPTSPDVDLI